ncbi:MAG: molybdopterin cofactor-binding domain-containing protein [Casimicrobiaceae bacterium]
MNLAFSMAAADLADVPRLPGSLQVNRRLGQWLRFRREGYVEVRSGKVELGQGIATALAQIVADELDVTLAQVRMIPASTPASPDEAITSGSLSVQESGLALRHACAEARAIYLAVAATRLGLPAEELDVTAGQIGHGRHAIDYWTLADDALLDRDASGAVPTKVQRKDAMVGRSVPRLDLPDKVFGLARFIHDIDWPDLLHGRVLQLPSPHASLRALDVGAIETMAGVVRVIRDGGFVGVLAETPTVAARALGALAGCADWVEHPTLPDATDLGTWLKSQPAESDVVASRAAVVPSVAVRTLRAAFDKPFLAHASLAPSCALARWRDGTLEVWTHSQGIYNLRRDLALALRIDADAILVQHVEGAGCYGHNGADDVAFDAARLARAVPGRPVRVQWSRADELGVAPFGPAMHVELEADLDQTGAIVGWRHETWSNGHSTRPGRAPTPGLLGSWHLAEPFPPLIAINAPFAAGGGAERNSVPCYDLPAWHVVKHRVLAMPIRTSALRSLGAFTNVFAIESFIDQLAALASEDPVAFRLRHLGDPRSRAVLERAAECAGWSGWTRGEGRGHGIGFARYKHTGAYCAVVAEVNVAAAVQLSRLVIAVDVGQVINPDGVVNQIEGGAIQAAGWTLREALRFDRTRIASVDWESYPVFRFEDVPEVRVEVIDRVELPSVGAGEASMGPTAGAIANAVADALGVRFRALPLTADRLRAAIG